MDRYLYWIERFEYEEQDGCAFAHESQFSHDELKKIMLACLEKAAADMKGRGEYVHFPYAFDEALNYLVTDHGFQCVNFDGVFRVCTSERYNNARVPGIDSPLRVCEPEEEGL